MWATMLAPYCPFSITFGAPDADDTAATSAARGLLHVLPAHELGWDELPDARDLAHAEGLQVGTSAHRPPPERRRVGADLDASLHLRHGNRNRRPPCSRHRGHDDIDGNEANVLGRTMHRHRS